MSVTPFLKMRRRCAFFRKARAWYLDLNQIGWPMAHNSNFSAALQRDFLPTLHCLDANLSCRGHGMALA
jgi:hypothetical protein